VLTTPGTVDVYNGKVLRSTVGSLFHVPIVQGLAIDDIVTALADRGVQSFGLAGGGALELFDIDDELLREPTAWWLGSESQGLPDDLRSRVEFVAIPMPGGAESLNAAVAGAIAMYASVRAQHHLA
jgi:TrmH family RNA methyltransferase